jgi:hypothetical protein
MATSCSNKSSHLALPERNVASTTVETLTCDKLTVSYLFPRHNLSRLNATNGRLFVSTRSVLLHQRPPSSRHSTTQVTTLYGIWKFITVLTRAIHRSIPVSQSNPIHNHTTHYSAMIRFNIVLTSMPASSKQFLLVRYAD